MASPRKGDTSHPTQRIEEEMARQADVSFDYLWLREADPRPCT
ncbi:MAG TPA: flavodoxin family protein, partial [Armatimonadetes bacterium]|nr:flavodoxin family protein [Armatimonadota bacterium]